MRNAGYAVGLLGMLLTVSGCGGPRMTEPAPPEPVDGAGAQRAPVQEGEAAAFEAPTVLHDRVDEALSRAPGLDASNIAVRVEGSDIYLHGTVPTSSQRALAHEVAHSVEGVGSVVSDGLGVR